MPNNIRFTLESTSKKELESITNDIIKAIRSTGAVKTGPVPFKNKRLIDCWNCNSKTIARLMAIKRYKLVTVTIDTDCLKS
jgi:ribosomal protein S10